MEDPAWCGEREKPADRQPRGAGRRAEAVREQMPTLSWQGRQGKRPRQRTGIPEGYGSHRSRARREESRRRRLLQDLERPDLTQDAGVLAGAVERAGLGAGRVRADAEREVTRSSEL